MARKKTLNRQIEVAFRFAHEATTPVVAPVWPALPPEVREAAAAAFFLLSPAPRPQAVDIPTFATQQLPRLLLSLSRCTERSYARFRGQVRGRIAWASTFKARYSQDYDPTVYVCREVRYEYDTLENQLLRYLVQRIRYSLDALPETIQRGLLYFPETGRYERIQPHLAALDQALERARRDIKFRQVPLPATVNETHLVQASSARLEAYGVVADLYRRYDEWVLHPAPATFAALGQKVLFLPHRADGPGAHWLRMSGALLQLGRPVALTPPAVEGSVAL